MSFRPSAEIRIILRAIDQASTQMKAVGASAQGLGGQLSGLGKIASIAGGMIVADLALRAGGAIQRFVNDSIKEFGEFESILAKVMASSGEVGLAAVQLADDIREAAMAAGREFGVGATQATAAMEALVKAGMKGDEAVTALKGTLMLATIEEMNTADAAKYVVQSLGMFGKSAEDATEMVDILTNASIKGVDTVREYAIGLGYCGKTMATYGMTAEDAAASLVALNNQGIQAEKAGRYLDAMFRDLIENVDKLGFEVYDASGSMVSMDEIIRRLIQKLSEFGTEQERNAYLAEVFGTQSRRAVLALVDMTYEGEKGADAFKLLADAMGESGSAAEYFARLANTQEMAMKRLNAAMEEARIELGEALSPIIIAFADLMEDHVVPAIKEFAEHTDNLVWLLGKFEDALAPVTSKISELSATLDAGTGGMLQLSDAFLYLIGGPGALLTTGVSRMITLWRDNEAMMLLNKVAAGELTVSTEELYDAVHRVAEATGHEEQAILDEIEAKRTALGLTMLTTTERLKEVDALDKTSFASMENFTAAQELARAEEEVAISTAMSTETLEELAKQLDAMEEIYLENVIKKNVEFQAAVDETARVILDLCETSENVDEFSEDAQHAIDTLAKEWGIDFEDAKKIVESAMADIQAAIEEVPKTVEEELLQRAQDNLEKFKQCVSEKSTATKEEFKAAWDALVTDTNELIARGLIGQAQDNIQTFADCVIDKEADMVQEVDALIEKLTEEMNSEFDKMMAYADQFTGAERDMWIARAEELKEGYLTKIAALEEMKQIALTRMLLADQGFATEEINTIMAGLIQLKTLSGAKWDEIVAKWNAALREAKGDVARAIAAIQAEINSLTGKSVTITTTYVTRYVTESGERIPYYTSPEREGGGTTTTGGYTPSTTYVTAEQLAAIRQIGEPFVPYTGFHAILHRGEAILREEDARSWRRGLGRGGDIKIVIEKAVLTSDQNIRETAQKLAHYEAMERRRQGLS